MNYILKLSLEYIALVKVVGILWNEEDIRGLIEQFCTPFNSTELKNEWPKIEERVQNKVPQLLLPIHLKEKTLALVKPIGSQILRWVKYLGDSCFVVHLPDEFHWTSQGTIDEKKIAEVLIKDESIDICTRYKMSCIYCLEDDILKLWHRIPEVCKKSFYSAEDPTCINQPELVVLWTYDIKGEVSKMEPVIRRKLTHRCSPYQYAFENAANEGNKLAVGYFLKKLTFLESEESLIRTAGSVAYMRLDPHNKHTGFLYEYYSDILCILLTHMDEVQQTKIFQSFPYQVLKCFLDWPWQIFFVKTFCHMWNFLPVRFYDILLLTMIRKVKDGYKDFDYQKLFLENWQEIPITYKRYFLSESILPPYLLSDLLKIRDEDIIKLIFQDATVREKKRIIYSDFLIDLINGEECDLIKFFIQEYAPSKDQKIIFKAHFEMYLNERSSRDKSKKIHSGKWCKFLNLLDDISGLNKRKCVKNENGKRMCTEF